MIPRYLVENHIAFEVAHRIRSGVRSRDRLVRYGIEAVLTDKY
ncbi:protein of unassigned function [Methylobacterium oryzae CBMB20]|nr:protein of unassigned function [Methylobacterium oryzae CBMB20]